MHENAYATATTKLATTITIPASGAAATIRSLLSAAERLAIEGKRCVGVKILPNGAAWKWGKTSTVIVPVGTAETYNEPAGDGLDDFVAMDAGALAAVAVLYFANG